MAVVAVLICDTVPMPMALMVLPVDSVQAPAAKVVNQFYGRCRVRPNRSG